MIIIPLDFDLSALDEVALEGVVPRISPEAVDGLKFSAALPPGMAIETLGERFTDTVGARAVLAADRIIVMPRTD